MGVFQYYCSVCHVVLTVYHDASFMMPFELENVQLCAQTLLALYKCSH